MAKNGDMMSRENLKRIGVLLFLTGFLFAQPLLAGFGAAGWGALTLYELINRGK